MKRQLLHFVFWILIFTLCYSAPIMAQVHLDRISVAERADGLGYVLRYHLSQPLDSVAISRPDINRVQMRLYAPGLTTDEYLYISPNEVIRQFQFFEFSDGLGIELVLASDVYYSTQSYPDQNLRDVLLAFERRTRQEMEAFLAETDTYDILQAGDSVSPESEGPDEPGDAVVYLPEEEEPVEEYEESIRVDEDSWYTALLEKERTTASLQSLMPGDPMEYYMRIMVPFASSVGLPSYHIRPVNMKGYEPVLYEQNRHVWSDHPFFSQMDSEESSSNFSVFSQELYFSHNTKRPDGYNDGALWQGRGSNMAASTGVSFHYGPFRGVFRPVLVHSENREYELSNDPQMPGLSPYAMAMTNIDLPQRFGEESVNRIDLGDSFAEFEYSGFSGGFSNQRMWTGPAVHNPLMFSTNAPGFLHVFAGTSRPVSVPGGRLEGRMFWGSLKESDYFDENPDNDRRFITGLLLNYSPDFLPGLHLGFSRVGYSYYGSGLSASDLFMVFQLSPPKPDPQQADPEEVEFVKSSFFIRWAYPRIGFETYAEWGRNDDRRRFRDFIAEPELNRGYVLGVIQRVPLGRHGAFVLNGEITNLENSSVTAQFRDVNIWYANDVIRHGFTNRGQVLGAAIGPGSSTQIATAHYYHKYGMVGISLARIALHNDRLFKYRDYYHSTLPRDWMSIRRIHEVEIRHGLHGLVFLPGNLELQMDLHTGLIENRHNNYDRPRPGSAADDIIFDERNVHVSFTLRYQLDGFLR